MHDNANATAPSSQPNKNSGYPSMKIKRFVAADMRTAMNHVRKEHGPDAVILSNRRIEEGVEIVAAMHYDEDAVQRALEASRRTPVASKARSAAEAIFNVVTRRKAPDPAPPTTSAVAALARSAVGATSPTIESSQELPASSRFTALRPPQAEPAGPSALKERSYTFSANELDDTPVVPAFRPAGFAAAVAAAVAERAEPQAKAPVAAATPEAAPPAPQFMPWEVEPELAPQAAAAPAPQPQPAPVAPSLSVVPTAQPENQQQLSQLRNEMASMRQLIEREMNRFTDERLRGSPVRCSALDLMDEYGFDAGLARDVVMEIPLETERAKARGLMLGLISRKLPVAPIDPIETGGVIALVGPTGAGKTTTIAKLASRFAEAHAARDVALVTTDTQRIGAREQLYGYGRQLGIAVHEANSSTNLNQLLERLADYKLVLIDTAGLGQRDRGLAAQLQWLRAAGQIRTLLVLPANTSFQDMDEVVRRFGAANPQGLVLTKLDETGRFGSALSIAVDHRLPITWVTDGQDVPEDLHRASAANLVLRLEDLRRAADMPCNPEFDNAVA